MGWENTCIERPLRKGFGRLGRLIGRKPLPFLLVPLTICLLLSIGLLKFESYTEVIPLFTPTNGAAKDDQKVINRLFPFNESDAFSLHRRPDFGQFITVTLANETGDVLSGDGKHVMDEIESLIFAIKTSQNETFETLCAGIDGSCAYANMFDLINFANDLLFWSGLPEIIPTYPHTNLPHTDIAPERLDMTFLSDVENTERGVIKTAKFWTTAFFLQKNDREFIEMSLETLLKLNTSVASQFPGSKLSIFTSLTLDDELANTTFEVLPSFSYTVILIIAFVCFNCMLSDWITSKPLMGLIGCLSAMLAIGAAFGVLCAAGLKIVPVALISPFLALAIGIDDMFVMLSAWRATDPAQAPHERLSHCMSDAAVSITITTVTDILGIGVGAFVPFKAIQLFCVFTGVALAFTCLIQITFLAAYMALDGRREADKRHAITFTKVAPQSQTSRRSWAYRLFCTGGPTDSRSTTMTRFFREQYGPFLMRWQSRVVVMLLYVCYLAAAIYGVTTLEEGMILTDLSTDDSYSNLYFEMTYKHLRKYGEYVSVAVEAPLNYSKPANHARIEDLLQQYEENRCFHGPEQTISWLRSFKIYQKFYMSSPSSSFDVDVQTFLNERRLDNYFHDVAFEDNRITATRYLVRLKDVTTTAKDKECMLEARRIADESDLEVTAFSAYFIFFDQFVYILPETLKNLGAATAIMLVVCLLFIPDPICSLWVVVAIVSIEVGVVGYMALWSLKLNSVSMICLLVGVGFCVDFSAHIAYAYSISESPRLPNALGRLGVPIVQGGVSTFVGIIFIAFSESPIFRTTFKIIFLVIGFGLLHGIVFLPIWLDMSSMFCRKEKNRESSQKFHIGEDGKKVNGNEAIVRATVKENERGSRFSFHPEGQNGQVIDDDYMDRGDHKDILLRERLLSKHSFNSAETSVKERAFEKGEYFVPDQSEHKAAADNALTAESPM